MPKSVDKIFIEREVLEQDLKNFLENREVKYLTILEDTFNSIKDILKSNRFIPMEKDYCYDKKINGCWLGLCENSFEYFNVSSGNNYKEVLKELREFYKNSNIDIPTKKELKKLKKLPSNAPFTINYGGSLLPNININHSRLNGFGYFLFKKNDIVQYYHIIRYDISSIERDGNILPIYRLYDTSKDLLDKEHFLLWIANGLKPKSLKSKSYDKLLKLDIKIDNNLNIINISKIITDYTQLIEDILKADKLRADLVEYPRRLINDIERGSWEAFNHTKRYNFQKPIGVKLDNQIVVKNPKESIVKGGVIGIDFGTKSTVVVYQKNNEKIFPIRVGSGDWSKKGKIYHYENPTIMEFNNIERFLSSYMGKNVQLKSRFNIEWINIKSVMEGFGTLKRDINLNKFRNYFKGLSWITIYSFFIRKIDKFYVFLKVRFIRRFKFRPKTRWDDLTVSYTAQRNFENSSSNMLGKYVTELKQWAGDKNRKLRIEYSKGKIYELKEFNKLKDGELNPIELYAYYLGLYINNQHSDDIYLEYILSFPITYDLKTREKILKSFERGIKKSLPDVGNKIKSLKVSLGVSEPASYASIALQEYGLAEESEKNFYGIFDFGGGTTDFDFGIFRWADEDKKDERRYSYIIENFGAGGDRYLGGENLLELLAFEVFQKNSDIFMENDCSFIKPVEGVEFLGSELLISDTREAKLNMVNLIKELRKFWERDNLKDKVFGEDSLKVNLYDNSGEPKFSIELDIDEDRLLNILKSRIEKGIDSFFASLEQVFESYSEIMKSNNIDKINIFLAGNSSKSPIVKEIFNRKIHEFKIELNENDINTDIKIFNPLNNREDFSRPNGKTGVAFGLIETRSGGVIKVIDRNTKGNDIRFNFYIGKNLRGKFNIIINRDSSYHKWYKFTDIDNDYFEIYYTSSPLAFRESLSISDSSINKIRLSISLLNRKNGIKYIYIRLTSPNSFEYGIGESEDSVETINVINI